jgi:SAM-dependent methyltransferase
MPASARIARFESLLRRLREQRWLDSGGGEIARRLLHFALAELKRLFGIDSYLDNEDRRVLERVIFPYFLGNESYRTVLFVGCSWCTRGYNKRFEPIKDYWTIDPWDLKKRYGAKRHIVDELQNLGRHFAAGSLDLILCNGVFGCGLNDRAEVERAFGACFDALREGGVLLVGWADIDTERPFPLSECAALRAYVPFVFPPLGTAEFLTDTPYRDTYSFFAKPGASTSRARGPG